MVNLGLEALGRGSDGLLLLLTKAVRRNNQSVSEASLLLTCASLKPHRWCQDPAKRKRKEKRVPEEDIGNRPEVGAVEEGVADEEVH
jgi:hypothetical protein